MKHGIRPKDLRAIREILKNNCAAIERVGLFGSRATGRFTRVSDIDLVLYGNISEREGDRLKTCFLESMIPNTVDITVYERIGYLPLKRHIDLVVRELLTGRQIYEAGCLTLALAEKR